MSSDIDAIETSMSIEVKACDISMPLDVNARFLSMSLTSDVNSISTIHSKVNKASRCRDEGYLIVPVNV
jgi:hypothetical protein